MLPWWEPPTKVGPPIASPFPLASVAIHGAMGWWSRCYVVQGVVLFAVASRFVMQGVKVDEVLSSETLKMVM